MRRDWEHDPLGPDFEQLTLPLGTDDEGHVVATLVRYHGRTLHPPRAPLSGFDVLYVHGWSDYFFQAELAHRLAGLGARFHALDLRKYGRSLLPGQTPGYTASLDTYDEDIAAAIDVITEERGRPPRLLLVGHSTGGLTLSLWAARHPELVEGVLLNSPWLEFQATAVGRAVLTPFLHGRARLAPLGHMPVIDLGFYARTVSAEADGEWTYRRDWRPDHGFALHPGWLDAVFQGQAAVAAGVGLTVPVLVLISDRSLLQPRWDEEMSRADVALNVDVIAHRSLSLGDEVTVRRVRGAVHDVFLSSPDAREAAYEQVRRWARVLET